MASKLDVSSAIHAANAARTADEPPAEAGGENNSKPISLRIRERDHNRFRSLFAKSGLSLAAGCVMAITYVVEMIEAGAFTVSKAGVQDIRGRKGA
jgi:hypothetical protein